MCQKCGNNACGGCQPQIPQGLPGANGKNAYNFTTASFTMPDAQPASPATNADVTITVRSTGQFTNQWAIPGQIVYITGAGHFEVRSTTGNNQITVRNLGYTGNATVGVTIPSGATVSPAGLIGLTGAAGGNGTAGVANIYSDATSTSTATLTVTTIKTAPVPANTLTQVNDALQITATFNHTRNAPYFLTFPDKILIQIAGQNVFVGTLLDPNTLGLPASGKVQFSGRATRTGSDSIRLVYTVVGFALNDVRTITEFIDFSGLDFTSQINVELRSVQGASSVIVATGLFIDKIQA